MSRRVNTGASPAAVLARPTSPSPDTFSKCHWANFSRCISFLPISAMCNYSGVLPKESTHAHTKTNKKERRKKWEKLKEERKRVHKRTTRERARARTSEERYVCICVKRRKRKDPFAKTVLYCLRLLRHRPRRFTFVSRQWHRPLASAARRRDAAHSSAISSHRKVCPYFDTKPRRRSIIRSTPRNNLRTANHKLISARTQQPRRHASVAVGSRSVPSGRFRSISIWRKPMYRRHRQSITRDELLKNATSHRQMTSVR